MSEALKLADVLISVRLDTTAYKKQIAGLSRQTPQIAQNNKAMITGLRQEIALKKATMRLDQQREKMLGTFSKFASMGAVGAVGMVGGGLKAFLQSTDPAARKLNASLAKLKTASWQLMANVGKVANAKWNITGNIDKLVAKIKSLSKEDINAFLDSAKVTIMVAGFARMAMYAMKIKDYFEMLTIRKLMMEMATMKGSNILGGAGGNIAGTAVGAGIGAGLSTRISNKMFGGMTALGIGMQKTAKEIGKVPERLKMMLPFGMAIEGIHNKIGKKLQNIGTKGSNIIPTAPLLGAKAPVTGGGLATLGATILAVVGLGVAFRAMGDVGLNPLEKIISGLNKAISVLVKSFLSIVEVVGTLTDIIGSFLGSIFMVIKDAITGNWHDLIQDFKGFDNPMNNFRKMSDNLSKIWTMPVTGQDNLQKFGSTDKGSFQDLNAMFQKMFEENYQKLAVEATDKNTQATIENTAALQKIVTTPQTQHYTFNPKQSGAESVYNNTGFMGSTITGANTVSRVTF